jgi:hypothetical protein
VTVGLDFLPRSTAARAAAPAPHTGTLGMLLAIWVKHILGYDRLRPDDRGHACESS